MNEYIGMICPHCGAQTTVDPALLTDESPMPYCPECDEELFPMIEPEDYFKQKLENLEDFDQRGREGSIE